MLKGTGLGASVKGMGPGELVKGTGPGASVKVMGPGALVKGKRSISEPIELPDRVGVEIYFIFGLFNILKLRKI